MSLTRPKKRASVNVVKELSRGIEKKDMRRKEEKK